MTKKEPARKKKPVVSALEAAASKVDTSSWQRVGALAGAFFLTMGGFHMQAASNNDTHWKIERAHKDSLQTASDSIAAIKDDLILRKLDTTIQWQKLHSHNDNGHHD